MKNFAPDRMVDNLLLCPRHRMLYTKHTPHSIFEALLEAKYYTNVHKYQIQNFTIKLRCPEDEKYGFLKIKYIFVLHLDI